MSKHPYSIPSREEILSVLRTSESSLSASDIGKKLSLRKQECEAFFKRLAAMERDDQIRLDRHGYYQLTNPSNFIAARVVGHRDGYGFAVRDDNGDDLYLSTEEMKKVMHSDHVLLRVIGYDRRGRPEGRIVEVIRRANTHVIGRLLNENGVMLVVPEDKRIGRGILIPRRSQGRAKVGQVVSVELINYPTRYNQPIGRVAEVLGDIEDPGMEIEIAVRKHGVPYQFSPQALAEADALPDEVRASDIKYRVDLRDVPLITIDGEDARDFDDAVYCEPCEIGRAKGYRLIVAIADVSHYLIQGGPIEVDALERSTSVYFPRRVISMLPEKLSNGLCSLNPGVDRVALVCDMTVTLNGDIKAYQFYSAVIHSAARLTYTQVGSIFANTNKTKGLEAERLAGLLPHIWHLYDLYKVLAKARKTRGTIEFDSIETHIVCNTQGKIEQILPRTRNDAHRLIEECMLSANVCAADFMKLHKHVGLYRIHGGPSGEKLNTLQRFLKTIGLSLGGGDAPSTGDYAQLMSRIDLRPDALMIKTMVLRSMQQAIYSPHNIGHFGLAYEAYTHFTSPIRRYPDLLTHRVIKAIIDGGKYVPKLPADLELATGLALRARILQKDCARDETLNKTCCAEQQHVVWEKLAVHCSANERRADEASRDVEAWLKCYFMREKIGEEYNGTISAVTAFGIFVQLDSLFIDGLVHVTELESDYFEFNETHHELRGERTGIRYRLMDAVRVQVVRVDLDARKIDFRLVRAQDTSFGLTKVLNSKRVGQCESIPDRKRVPSVVVDAPVSLSSGNNLNFSSKIGSKMSLLSTRGVLLNRIKPAQTKKRLSRSKVKNKGQG